MRDGLPDPLPPPGLRGDYSDTCVICLRGTDTGIGLAGRSQFVAAVLHVLGVPLADAMIIVGEDHNLASDEPVSLIMQVCASCAEAANLRLRVGLIPDEVPFYGEPDLRHE